MWSLTLTPGQTVHQEVSTPFKITNICLGETVASTDRSLVKLFHGIDSDEDDDKHGQEAVLAALIPGQAEQVSVDITIDMSVDYLEFTITGDNPVHLVGHYLADSSSSSTIGATAAFLDSDDEAASDLDEEEMRDELADLQKDHFRYKLAEANRILDEGKKRMKGKGKKGSGVGDMEVEEDEDLIGYKYDDKENFAIPGDAAFYSFVFGEAEENSEEDPTYREEEGDGDGEMIMSDIDDDVSTASEWEDDDGIALDNEVYKREMREELEGLKKARKTMMYQEAKRLVEEHEASLVA